MNDAEWDMMRFPFLCAFATYTLAYRCGYFRFQKIKIKYVYDAT